MTQTHRGYRLQAKRRQAAKLRSFADGGDVLPKPTPPKPNPKRIISPQAPQSPFDEHYDKLGLPRPEEDYD
jgi:hypothetical protein